MNVALRKPMTVAEFLAWEERQELRYEFDGLRPIAMTGGTYAHDAIAVGLSAALSNRLRGKPCRPHGPNLKIETTGKVRYPDAFVSCGSYRPNDKLGHDPVVIFEVLSESSEQTDLIFKNEEYEALPSVQRYVVLQQDRIGGMMFERVNGDWIGHILRADAVLAMPEIGIELPIAELYERVDYSVPETSGEPA
jgi:Uma2 family endonuclease